MNRSLKLVGCLFAFVACFSPLHADSREKDRTFQVALRPGVFAKVAVSVISDQSIRAHGGCWWRSSGRRGSRGATILAVPGLGHSAEAFRAWAEHLFTSDAFDGKVSQVVLLDFPGHGESGLPTPSEKLLFGQLTLGDYASTLSQVLRRLRARGVDVDTIVAHSMGGLITQMVQERLLNEKSSLRALGVKSVMLVGSNMPKELPWYFADSGVFAAVAPQFIKEDATLGTHFYLAPEAWLALFFRDLANVFASGTPSPADVVARSLSAPESLFAVLELGGANGFSRPSVRSGAFSSKRGTKVSVVAMEQDIYSIFATEPKSLWSHLTGLTGEPNSSFVTITGPETVHDIMITNPAALDVATLAALQ